jgi:hypothetical protein
MITVFERIPDLFVQIYDPQFRVWAAEFARRGPKCAIVFDRPPGVPALLDEEGRVVAAGCWLEAEVDRSRSDVRVVIRPASEHDAEMIARHCREMLPHVLQ